MTTNSRETFAAMDADEMFTMLMLLDGDERIMEVLRDEEQASIDIVCKKFIEDYWKAHERDPSYNEWLRVRVGAFIMHLTEVDDRIEETKRLILAAVNSGKEASDTAT